MSPMMSEEPRSVEPAEEPAGKDNELAQCTMCREPRRCLRRHVHSIHLPWFWVPEKACWHCQSATSSQVHLQGKHWDAHEDLGKFGPHQLSTRFLSITVVLEVFTEHFGVPWEKLGELAQERGWLGDLEPAQSMVREVLWSQLVRYWGGTVESVATSSPCDLSTVLHWRTAMRMMAELPAEQRSQVSGASLVHGPPRRPTHAWVVDGHCHLKLLRQRVSIYATVERPSCTSCMKTAHLSSRDWRQWYPTGQLLPKLMLIKTHCGIFIIIIISIFILGCCPCPTQWGWQHEATLNSGTPSISVLWVYPSQAAINDISLDTFRSCLSMPSFPSGAGKRQVCDRFDTGRGTLYMSMLSQLPTTTDCCNILNAKFPEYWDWGYFNSVFGARNSVDHGRSLRRSCFRPKMFGSHVSIAWSIAEQTQSEYTLIAMQLRREVPGGEDRQ